MFVQFTIYNSIHDLPKHIIGISVVYFDEVSKCKLKCVSWFGNLVLWLWKTLSELFT